MTDLGPHTRALLDSARRADDDEMNASRDRVRGALGRKLGVAAVGISVTTAATAGAGTTTSLGVGLLGKVLIGLAAVGITAGGVAVSRRPSPQQAPPPSAIVARPQPLPPVVTPAPAEPKASPSASAEVLPSPLPPTVVLKAPPSLASPSGASGAPTGEALTTAAIKPSLTAEVAALARANDAITAGNPAAALTILDAAPSSGTLAEERTGLRLLARCALGHADAPAAAKSFLAEHPKAPLASRVRVACAKF